MPQSIQQLCAQIQAMSSDRVKDLVLSWLTHTNGNLSDLERLIAENADRPQEYQWGEIKNTNQFSPLTEAETIARSLEVLQDYQANKRGISHDRIKQWADSLSE
jgi:hypothetical protein